MVPIDSTKRPLVKGWQETRVKYDFSFADGVGLVCGAISGNVEVVDVDCKYDLTGTLFDRFKKAIHKADKTILPLLTVQKTRSGGYHLIYRCELRSGNRKLAQRHATEDEMNWGESKRKVLIETRGDGGYIAIWPTEGYEVIFGDLKDIKEITPEQRNTLHMVATDFNEVVEEYVAPKPKAQVSGLTPLDDYDHRGDCVELLKQHGWTYVGKKGPKLLLKRPGSTTAPWSGNFDTERNWFTVFSTSTEFEEMQAYKPSAVFAILEHQGDFNAAAKDLYDQGYGERVKREESSKPHEKLDTLPDPETDELEFLATEEDYQDYHRKLRDGTFKEFPGFGIGTLDKHLRLKDGDLYIWNGIDNVGKSTVIWYLMLLASMLYDWRWVVFTAENSVGGFMRKMIEFYWCKPITDMTDAEYKEAHEFVKAHFSPIKATETLYTSRQVRQMAERVSAKLGKHKGLMIDPYNALTLGMRDSAKNSTHEEHYEQLTELKLWGRANDYCIMLNTHAITEASRRVDSDGHVQPPLKGDTEGGVKSANKADQFGTIHRKTQHPDEWMMTQIHIRKVKETESGGKMTMFDNPVILRMLPGGVGYEEIDHLGRTRNPILALHMGEDEMIYRFEPGNMVPLEVAEKMTAENENKYRQKDIFE